MSEGLCGDWARQERARGHLSRNQIQVLRNGWLEAAEAIGIIWRLLDEREDES